MNTYKFKIETKTGTIIAAVAVEGRDEYEAKARLDKQYPGCKILGVTVK